MSEKIYVGNGKTIKTQYGNYLKITIDLDSLIREFDNYGFTTDAGKRKIKLNIPERKEADSYGNTHAVTIDTWKPDGGTQQEGGGSSQGFGNNTTSGYQGQNGAGTNGGFTGQQSGFTPPKQGFESFNPNAGKPSVDDFEDSTPF